MARILLHVCCGPCAIVPIRKMLDAGFDVTGWFYNPNVQPLREYLRRREGALQVTAAHGVPLLFPEEESGDEEEYALERWCREALAYPAEQGGRCAYCRETRLLAAARKAKNKGFDAFTSSLLYSRRQNHEGMKQAGEKAAQTCAAPFHYRDFRPFWQEGISASKQLGIYRQQWCGCVFSEEERFAGELQRTISPAIIEASLGI
ncbi:hypothetical protein FACS1894206_08520 [Deltaproteobacteria bacterium]|nr:hypothetical protein FACS1894206_08520 [Deltaproteobacteria bacterium]